MKYLTAALVAFSLMATPVMAKKQQSSNPGVNVGTLTCKVEAGIGYVIGSSRGVTCTYNGNGRTDTYRGSISRLGLDLGVTDNQTIVWAVFAPGKLDKKALEGNYFGATAEATVGIGLGVNVLVGGMKKSITLQPVSVSGQTGLAVVAAGTSMHLKAVKPSDSKKKS